MIRVVTLDSFDDKQLGKLMQTLYTAFGVGTEHSGLVTLPKGFSEPLDAEKLLEQAPAVPAYQDDKVIYLTQRKLKDRTLPSGTAPTTGFCQYGKARSVISTHPVTDLEADENFKPVARNALHQLGHLWELHHCLDPRCSMYLPWTPSFAHGEAVFCTYCREKSEQKIRLAKS